LAGAGARRQLGGTFRHALQRSFLLLLFGWGSTVLGPETDLRFVECAGSLSFTYLVAFLMMRKSSGSRLHSLSGLLAITELAYRLWPVPDSTRLLCPTATSLLMWTFF